MSHNIIGNEVGRPKPPAYLTRLPGRRHRIGPVTWLFIGAAIAGPTLGLIDSLLIGRPVTILIAATALLAWRFWPERRS